MLLLDKFKLATLGCVSILGIGALPVRAATTVQVFVRDTVTGETTMASVSGTDSVESPRFYRVVQIPD